MTAIEFLVAETEAALLQANADRLYQLAGLASAYIHTMRQIEDAAQAQAHAHALVTRLAGLAPETELAPQLRTFVEGLR